MLNESKIKRDQYEMISVSELVPKNYLLRKVDKLLDLNFIYELVEDKYCLDNGRPSIDLVVLVNILLIQRLFGIKSMRQTIKEIETNVDYRWYLGFIFLEKCIFMVNSVNIIQDDSIILNCLNKYSKEY